MQTIKELSRQKAPAPLPQALAFDGTDLWIGSLDDKCIYQIDTASGNVKSKTPAPGYPFGMVSIGDELRVLCGETAEDNRIIRSLTPGDAFCTAFALPCPEDTGSQLSYDGSTLYVSQWYNQKILALAEDGTVAKAYDLPRGICAQVFAKGAIYAITTADEENGEYYIGKLDLASGAYEDLALVPFPARALAFDGEAFLSNHRAAGETVRFTI